MNLLWILLLQLRGIIPTTAPLLPWFEAMDNERHGRVAIRAAGSPQRFLPLFIVVVVVLNIIIVDVDMAAAAVVDVVLMVVSAIRVCVCACLSRRRPNKIRLSRVDLTFSTFLGIKSTQLEKDTFLLVFPFQKCAISTNKNPVFVETEGWTDVVVCCRYKDFFGHPTDTLPKSGLKNGVSTDSNGRNGAHNRQ